MGKIDFLDFDYSGCEQIHITDLPQPTQEMLKKAGYPTGVFHIGKVRVDLERNGVAFWIGNTLEDALLRIQNEYETKKQIDGFGALLQGYGAKFWRITLENQQFKVVDVNIEPHYVNTADFTADELDSLVAALIKAEEERIKHKEALQQVEQKRKLGRDEYRKLVSKSLKTKKDKEAIEALKASFTYMERSEKAKFFSTLRYPGDA